MGVDFNNGSMSYPRYDNFVASIANHFKGVANVAVPDDTDKVFYCFGFLENQGIKEKFTFEEDVPEIIKKFCNNSYGDLSDEEVKSLYSVLNDIKDKVEHVGTSDKYTMDQFLNELKYCIDYDDDWYIG